ncbi:MAG: alpha amylase C-terminal domain-containing protein [Lachnospiraceae bacterium]|nr:alpha amylase C-terminal domain-containing protein [Lachnospiraceae bacterium]
MNKKQYALMNWEQIESIVYADCANPSTVLGLHTRKKEVILQAYFPESTKVFANLYNEATKKTKKVEMELVDESGFYAAFLTKETFTSYTYTVEYANTQKCDIADPYAFHVNVDEKAVASMKRGTNERLSEVFGSKVTEMNKIPGVLFTVYAPGAEKVSILADFNGFKEGCHLMEKNESTGVFALFVPGVKEGCEYRYSIKGKGPKSFEKADPFALCQNKENSVVVKTPASNAKKKASKSGVSAKNPMHLYEVDLFSLMDEKTSSVMDLLPVLVKHCKDYSYTGVHLMGFYENAPASNDRMHILGIYGVSKALGGNEVFASFIEGLHEAGLFVSFDFPIAYFAGDSIGLHFFDGEALFESAEERVMYKPTFGGFAFDFSNGFVSSYLLSAALSLIDTYHFDGIRIPDLSALLYLDYGKRDGEWLPNEYGGNLNLAGVRFLKKLNNKLIKSYPNVYKMASSDGVLENVTVKSGKDSLLFDAVLNTGFENSLISFLQNDPFYRNEHYYAFSELIRYAFCEEFILPLSYKAASKDFVSMLMRMPGTIEDKVDNVILANAFLTVFPGKKLSFMGTDNFCEEAYQASNYATSMKESRHLLNKLNCVKDIFALYNEKYILHPENENASNFTLIKADDPMDSVLIYKRSSADEKETEYVIFNFSNHAMEKYSFGLPKEGKIKEIFTTDDPKYRENGVINKNAIATKEIPMDGFNQSVTVKIPSMGMQIFSYRPFTEKELDEIARKKYMEKVRYVERKKKEIEEEKDRIIAAAVKDAEKKIKELEKILK